MKKVECINIFNTKLKEFLSDLIRVYPNDEDLIKCKASIQMLLLVNDKQILKLYKEMVYNKYKEEILSNNENFFMDHDYKEDIEDGNEYSQEFTDNLIMKIKSYWKTMSEENKMIVWSYFVILTKLCEKYELM